MIFSPLLPYFYLLNVLESALYEFPSTYFPFFIFLPGRLYLYKHKLIPYINEITAVIVNVSIIHFSIGELYLMSVETIKFSKFPETIIIPNININKINPEMIVMRVGFKT